MTMIHMNMEKTINMKILFVGDSWTFGDELQDRESTRFSKLVCQSLNAEEYNISNCGISNDEIAERTTLFLNKNSDIDYAVIQFTYLKRMTIPNINFHPKKYKTITPNSPNQFDAKVFKYYCSQSNMNAVAWYDLTKYKIILLHNYLNSLNINHLFLFITDEIINEIIKDPDVNESIKSKCYAEGLLDLCSRKNILVGDRYHALEAGHQYYADNIILPRIKNV